MKNNLFFKVNKLIKIIKIKNLINLISISLLISIMEFLSIFSIYPVFYYLENKKIVNNDYYNFVYNLFPVLSDNYVFEKILLISLILIFITSIIIYLRFSRKYKIKESIINRNRKFVFELISKTNLFHFKKIDHELIKSYLSIETQRISQIVLSFTNLCSSLCIIIFLISFIIYVEPYLVIVLFITILVLWLLLSKTYADSKLLGLTLTDLNNKFIKFIDKFLNDKSQFMLSINKQDKYLLENEVVKKIHFTQFQIQKKSAFIELVIKILTLSLILLTIYIFYLNNIDLSLILFTGIIFVRLIPYLSQFGNSLQNIKSNFPSVEKLIFIEDKLLNFPKIDLNNLDLKSIDLSSNILLPTNITKYKNNFRLYPGNIYGLFGSSGVGKTTFVESLLGLDRNKNFNFILNNEILLSDKDNSNVLAGSSYYNQNSIPNNFPISELFIDYDIHQINNYLSLFEMNTTFEKIRTKSISQFSGGEQQRLNLIYILLENKKLIILDEPTSGLDERMSLIVLNIFKDHIFKNNNLCIIVSHNRIILKNISRFLSFKNKI